MHGLVVTDCVYEAVVAVFLSVQHTILDEDGDGSQDEGHKQIHVNEVSGAVELPVEKRKNIYPILSWFHTQKFIRLLFKHAAGTDHFTRFLLCFNLLNLWLFLLDFSFPFLLACGIVTELYALAPHAIYFYFRIKVGHSEML